MTRPARKPCVECGAMRGERMPRRWSRGEWLVCASPTTRAVTFEDGEWSVYIDGRGVARGAAPQMRAARRAAEQWVARFARELLIACGEESP
jgi:hypothetical protein